MVGRLRLWRGAAILAQVALSRRPASPRGRLIILMQLAFSSNAYLRFSIDETIARIAALGYRGIELLADVPHAWPAGLLPAQKDAIRRALDAHDLAISNINAFM